MTESTGILTEENKPKRGRQAKQDVKPEEPTVSAKPAEDKPEKSTGIQSKPKAVRVSSLRTQGRYRAGRFFNLTPAEIPLTELSVEQIKMLQDDPVLKVEMI